MAVEADAERFYATAEKAFTKGPDPYLRFASTHYAECLQTLRAGLDGEDGLALLVGSPGVGKTTLSEEVGAWWRRRCGLVGKVTNTQVCADDFQRLVAYAFGISARGSGSSVQIKLEKLLQRQKARRTPPLLIVDEAQDLNAEAIEALRLLSNLSSDYQPLLRILLVAQDDFLERLGQKSLESLRQRLRVVVQLGPLDVYQTREYIAHQLRAAHWQGQPRLSGAALQAIYQFTQGVPRWINVSMRYLLGLGAIESLTTLDAPEIERVVAELAQQRLSPVSGSRARGGEPESVDPILLDLDAQVLQATSAPTESGPKLGRSNRLRDRLPSLDLAGLLEYQGGRVVRALARGRAAWGQSTGRNWTLGAGLAAVLALAVGVLFYRPPAPFFETTESSSATAGMLRAPPTNEALRPSRAAHAVMHVDPGTEARGVVGLAEGIRGLNSAVALPEAKRALGQQSIADSPLSATSGLPKPRWVDSTNGAAHGSPTPAQAPSSGSGSRSARPAELESEIETALQDLEIDDEGALEHVVLELAALPPTQAGRTDRSAGEAAPDAPQSSKVAKLLQAAAAAIAENRLTLPPKNNAYDYYRAVLAEEPRNRRARAGLGKIVARYRALSKSKLAAGRLSEAQRLVNRGLRVAADDRQLLALQADIANRLPPAALKADATQDSDRRSIADIIKRAIETLDPTTEEPDQPDPTVHHPFEF